MYGPLIHYVIMKTFTGEYQLICLFMALLDLQCLLHSNNHCENTRFHQLQMHLNFKTTNALYNL